VQGVKAVLWERNGYEKSQCLEVVRLVVNVGGKSVRKGRDVGGGGGEHCLLQAAGCPFLP